jgi:hypothetical protein
VQYTTSGDEQLISMSNTWADWIKSGGWGMEWDKWIPGQRSTDFGLKVLHGHITWCQTFHTVQACIIVLILSFVPPLFRPKDCRLCKRCTVLNLSSWVLDRRGRLNQLGGKAKDKRIIKRWVFEGTKERVQRRVETRTRTRKRSRLRLHGEERSRFGTSSSPLCRSLPRP